MYSYKNDYKSPSVDLPHNIHLETPVEEYDLNFVYPVIALSSDRVELRPYIPSLYAKLLFEGIKSNPEVFRYLGAPLWETLDDCLQWSEKTCRAPSNSLFYVIFTDPITPQSPQGRQEREFAGIIGMISTDSHTMMSEPGWIVILPQFQRTHVLTHAAGLIMHRILDPPSQNGLGLRRCQWTTTTLNTRSQSAAVRLGFKEEGIIRGNRILPPGKEYCRVGRKGDGVDKGDWGVRDDWVGSVMWYDWEEGVRGRVDGLMSRRI